MFCILQVCTFKSDGYLQTAELVKFTCFVQNANRFNSSFCFFHPLEWPCLLLSGSTVPSGTVTPTTLSHKQFLDKEFSFTEIDL